jgi:hypothetical protein
MTATESAPDPSLVPELLVDSLEDSLDFWYRLCGFEVLYDRPGAGFAYINCGLARIMIENVDVGRNWMPAASGGRLGRGVNFQISVVSIDPLVTALRNANWALFMGPEMKVVSNWQHRGGRGSVSRLGPGWVPDPIPIIAG